MPICTILLAVVLALNPPPAIRAIDPAKSKVQFSVTHVFVDHVIGVVPVLRGAVTLENGSAVPTNVTAVLDATKLATDDRDRNGVLQSPDWFDTAKFPTWTFASTKITLSSDGTFTMDGSLTIHGVTQPERLAVTIGGTPANPTYHAAGRIDRHAFGMQVTRLDPAIGNPVDVTLDVTLK